MPTDITTPQDLKRFLLLSRRVWDDMAFAKVLDTWAKHPETVIPTLDTVIELHRKCPNPTHKEDLAFLGNSLFRLHATSQLNAEDMREFLDKTQLPTEELQDVVNGKFIKNDKLMETPSLSYTFILSWLEQQRPTDIPKFLKGVASTVMKMATVHETEEQFLVPYSIHLKPSDQVSIYNKDLLDTWAHCWMYNALEYQGVDRFHRAREVLQWLVEWGIDLDQYNQSGDTALDTALSYNPSHDPKGDRQFMLETLTEMGADWKRAWKRVGKIKRNDLAQLPVVKKERLLMRLGVGSVEELLETGGGDAKAPHRQPKM